MPGQPMAMPVSAQCHFLCSSHCRHSRTDIFFSPVMSLVAFCWTCSVTSMSFFTVRGPELNAVFQVWLHQCWEKGDDPFLSPAGYTLGTNVSLYQQKLFVIILKIKVIEGESHYERVNSIGQFEFLSHCQQFHQNKEKKKKNAASRPEKNL